MSDEEPIGKVTDYFWKREVVRIEVFDGPVEDGDQLLVAGEYTDEVINVENMEVDDEPVERANEGEILAMPLGMDQRVMLGDKVYTAEEATTD